MTAATPPAGQTSGPVRGCFCPSPTGTPHVGLIRTALFNWALRPPQRRDPRLPHRGHRRRARHRGVLPELLEAMRWLGIDWDEGVEVGGPYGPYRQSERRRHLRDVAAPPDRRRATSTSPTPRPRRSRPGTGGRAGSQAGLRQRRPRPVRRPAGRLPGRGPGCRFYRFRMPDRRPDVRWTPSGARSSSRRAAPDFVGRPGRWRTPCTR